MKFDLCEKLDGCLNKGGFDIYFYCDDDPSPRLGNWPEEFDYADYISYSLRAATGILASNCLLKSNCLFENVKDLDLINKLATLLCESGDEDLKAVAWNTFLPCRYSDGFVLKDEILSAMENEYSMLCFDPDFPFWNKTPEEETERLLVKPLLKKDADRLTDYIRRYDREENGFTYMLYPPRNMATAAFGLYPKGGEEGPMGFIALCCFLGKEEGPAELSYYIKKKYRRKGYMKEAVSAVYDIMKNKRFRIFRAFRRAYVYEDAEPKVNALLIHCDKNNIASRKLAESSGFSLAEYDFGIEKAAPPHRAYPDGFWYCRKVE